MMMVVMMMVVMMVVVMMILLDQVCTLAAPSSACMRSVDMTHVLRWRPPLAACDTALLYSVQFQGEFELMHLKGTWLNAPECQLIPHTRCDLTFDLGSDSDYNLRVRAQCGSELSAWTELSPPFNRRDTVLMAPAMSVTAVGDALQVTFAKLPLTAVVSVTVWKSGDELQAVVYTMPADQAVLHVAALQEGAEYCVRAQTVLDARIRSGSTDAECVFITGRPDGAWKRPTTVGVTVIAMAALLFAVFWSVVHCRPHACQSYFHKEPLPRSLDPDWDIQIQVSPEEAELYEPIHVSAAP